MSHPRVTRLLCTTFFAPMSWATRSPPQKSSPVHRKRTVIGLVCGVGYLGRGRVSCPEASGTLAGSGDSGSGNPAASELIRLTAAELSAQLVAGEVSAVDVTQAHLDRINTVDGTVHAFLHIAHERALTAAADIDRRRAAGEKLHPLAGVPLAIKDVLTTRGMPTTAGSRILEGWIPPYDATSVRRTLDAGMIPLGKTNMDEFAMGSSTEHSAYGPTRNPWDLDRIPGG